MKHPSLIAISEYTYDLPPEKIANYPLADRDTSKLLVCDKGNLKESVFRNVADFIENDAVLVFNNTRVIPARLKFRNGQGKSVELFCLEPADNADISETMAAQRTARWNCLVGNLKHWKEPFLVLSQNEIALRATIAERRENFVIVEFTWDPGAFSFSEVLDKMGAMPIPPYLKRDSEEIDEDRYQTIYARHKGSVAAPTAGLHFTDFTFNELRKKSIQRLNVTLHVGAGTFKPIKSAIMQHHEMHAEWIEVEVSVIENLLSNQAKKIIAVGTTSLRTVESLYWMGCKALLNPSATIQELEVKQWDPYGMSDEQPDVRESLSALLLWLESRNAKKILCKTSILIAPPYDLKIAKGLITNFHQPQSTLLLLITAVVGEKWRALYDYALRNNFRFLSYGDSSLLLK